MVKIKKIGILSLGKILGILYALLGLILGAFITLFALITPAFSSTSAPGMFGALFGVGAIILLPIFYGVMGFVMGLIMALLYNLVASWVGGLEVETEK
jgi:hypothetical protein